MPELPEVETTLRGVSPHLVGRVINEILVREPRLRWPVPREIQNAVGHRIKRGRRRAKYLIFETDAGSMILHLGMSGSLRVVEPASEWRKHDHVAITMDNGLQLRLHDPRRFGTLLFCQEPDAHPLICTLGPEPLGDEFSAEHLHRASRGKKVAVKQFIMDAHVVVGVGNIYASEALFMSGIRPTKPAGKVSKEAFAWLVESIRAVLSASIEMGGTTLRDFLREDGEPGYFAQSLRVYDREGQACDECSAIIRRIVTGQRSTYYCPRCQR